MLTRIRAKKVRDRIARLLESASKDMGDMQYYQLLGELHCMCMVLADAESKRIYKRVATATAK